MGTPQNGGGLFFLPLHPQTKTTNFAREKHDPPMFLSGKAQLGGHDLLLAPLAALVPRRRQGSGERPQAGLRRARPLRLDSTRGDFGLRQLGQSEFLSARFVGSNLVFSGWWEGPRPTQNLCSHLGAKLQKDLGAHVSETGEPPFAWSGHGSPNEANQW